MLPVKFQELINQVTWGDITMQSCGTFSEILHNKLETIAKTLFLLPSFFFFLTPSPFNVIILQPFIMGEP